MSLLDSIEEFLSETTRMEVYYHRFSQHETSEYIKKCFEYWDKSTFFTWKKALDVLENCKKVTYITWSEERYVMRDDKKRLVNEKNELATITKEEIRSDYWTDFQP